MERRSHHWAVAAAIAAAVTVLAAPLDAGSAQAAAATRISVKITARACKLSRKRVPCREARLRAHEQEQGRPLARARRPQEPQGQAAAQADLPRHDPSSRPLPLHVQAGAVDACRSSKRGRSSSSRRARSSLRRRPPPPPPTGPAAASAGRAAASARRGRLRRHRHRRLRPPQHRLGVRDRREASTSSTTARPISRSCLEARFSCGGG